MPNPRTDITAAQYEALSGRGLTDAQIRALSAGGVQLLLDVAPAPAPAPRLEVPLPLPRAPRGREPDVMSAQREFVSQALAAQPGQVAEREARAQRLETVPFTPGGAIAPGMPFVTESMTSGAERAGEASIFSEAVRLARGQQEQGRGGAELLSGFLPQTVRSADTERDRRAREFAATRASFAQMKALVEAGMRPGLAVEDIENSPEFRQRRDAILSGQLGEDLEYALQSVGAPGRPLPPAESMAGAVLEELGPALADLGTRPTRMGEVVESPSMYAMRMLSVPTSAVPAVVEAPFVDATVGQTVGRRVREGMGFIGGGRDLGDYAGELMGLEQDDPVRAAMRMGGGALGLVGELMVPIDLGVTSATKLVSRGVRAGRLASETGAGAATSARLAREAMRKPSARTVNDSLIDLVAQTDEVQDSAMSLAKVLDEAPTEAAKAPEPPSTQTGLFGAPPAAVVEDVAEAAQDTLSAALRRSGSDMDAASFLSRLESTGVISRRVGQAVRQALTDGEDALAVLRRAAPAPGQVSRVSGQAPTVEGVAGVLALQAGARRVRSANLGGARVRITPRLVADRDVANKLFRDSADRPMAKLTRTLRQDDSYLVPAQPGGEVRVRIRDLVSDVDGLSLDDIKAAGIELPDGVNVIPLRVVNRAVLNDFEAMALASGKVQELAPVGGRLGGSEAPAVSGESLAQILRPVELRPAKLRAALEARLPDDAFVDVDPVLRPLVEELGRAWAGIDEEFFALMRQQRGVSRPVAFSRVMAGAYDSPRQMVGDVLANLYGGFETMGNMVFGASSHRVLMDLRASPARLRAEIAELLRRDPLPDAFADLVALFDRVGAGDEWGEATLSALMVACRRLSSEGVTLKSLGGTIDTTPIFTPERLVDLFAASYFQRRTAAIVSEVFTPDALRSSGYLSEFAPAEFIAGLRNQLNATGYGRPLGDRDVVEMLGFALCDEAVYRRANNPQQTWMFADLGITVPAPVRNLLSGYTDAQMKEIYSVVRDRAIDMTQATPVRSNYNEALRRYIELYADNKVNTPISRLEALGLPPAARRRLANLASPGSYQKMMQRIDPNNPVNNRLLLRLGDVFGNVGAGLERWAKGGLLGGRLLPNLVYMGVNCLTAPSIVYSTMGRAAGRNALARLGGISMGAAAPLRVHLGQTQLGVQIVARSPTGQVYTAGDVARLIPQLSTQGGAEISEDVVRSLSARSGLSARRVRDPEIKTVRKAGQTVGRRVLREWTGLDVSGLADEGASVQMNIWNQAANAQDLYFRVGVLVDALQSGRTTDEAVRLANDALFDYGRVSDLERNVVSRVVWFWSFRRESLRTTMINALESPERLRASYQSTNLFDDDGQYTVATKDYMFSRPFLKMVEDPETQRRYGIFGPGIPLLQGAAELVDYMSAGFLLLDGLLYVAMDYDMSPELFRPGGQSLPRRSVEAASVLSERGFQYALGQTSTPWVTLVSEVGLGIQRDNEGRPIGDYLDPRWLAYLRLNPDAEATFFGLVDIEPIPIEDEIPGNGTFQGRQWRVKEDSVSRRNYSALRHAMLFAGFDRTIRDYAPAYHAAQSGEGGELLPLQLQAGRYDSQALDALFQTLGATTPTNLPSVEERERGNQKTLEYIMREAQR